MSENHTHEHTHTHTHEHNHDHSHLVASSHEEAVALLRYMLNHNQHHADELHELAHCFEDEIADLVHDAVDSLQDSNNFMEQALALLDNSTK
ncbi:MAG: hypothetical protein KBS56_03345 [Clostridiales bacterium]|nr:hypothetical protein [Candidatus Crickella equi]